MHIFTRPGNLLLLLMVLTPLLVAVWSTGAPAWTDATALFGVVGRLAGVLGLVLLLVAALVSVRIPGLDAPFGGLAELWKVHHWLGAGAFLALMAHPLLLAMSALSASPQAAAAVLWPAPGTLADWLGWAALLVMMIYLAPSFRFFGAPHYQRWKQLHALSALAVALAFAHALMLGRSLPAWLWWFFGALVFLALAFRLGWRKLRPGRRFRITRVQPLAERVVELSLAPLEGPRMRHRAGQFIYLAPLDPQLAIGRREEHPYTISSAPDEAELRIGIKAFGDASTALQTVTEGSEALVDGPYGRFFEPGRTRPELWIGGGIGITPFVSRARAWRGSPATVNIHLVYCANDPDRAYYLAELQQLIAAAPGLRIWPHYFHDEGPLRAAWLLEHCPDAASRDWYACGPQPLLEITAALRRKFGVPRARYSSEAFDFL